MAEDSKIEREARLARRQERIASLTAIYSDTFSLLYGDGSIRINFGEYLYGEKHYRAAIVMNYADVESLVEELKEILEKTKSEGEKK